MITYYLYEVPGVKNGATKNWKPRARTNFKKYGVEPILIETIEGPDTPDMWQIVGDREWELADANGYPRGEHYSVIRLRPTKEGMRKGGRKGGLNGSREDRARAGRIGGRIGGKIAGKIMSSRRTSCPHCGLEGNPGAIATHIKFRHQTV